MKYQIHDTKEDKGPEYTRNLRVVCGPLFRSRLGLLWDFVPALFGFHLKMG